MYADMVGYSRLIGLDDAGTLNRLRALRRGLIDPAIDEHGGKIVQTGGDSLLIVFDSIDGAVRCAVQVQEQVPVVDADQPTDRAIRFRMGINIGDAIADGTDLHGDAVNVAARLQTECPPGGVCVSRSVRDHVRGRLDLIFEELGALNLKNISYPVEAFVLRHDLAATATTSPVRLQINEADLSVLREALPRSDKPSIAVLPFQMSPAHAEESWFAEGIVEDIIHMLASQREIFVISRGSTLHFSRPPIDAAAVARKLGVRYLLQGNVRRADSMLRIRTELMEAETGLVIRADQYDGVPDDLFELQERIAVRAAASIAPRVHEQELRRAKRKPPSSLTVYDVLLEALDCLYHLDAASLARARALLERAILLDPGYAPPYSYLAYWHILHVGEGQSENPDSESRAAARAAALAIEQDANDALALAIYGHVQAFLLHDYDQAVHYVDRALQAGPNCAMAWLMSSATRGYLSQGTEAVRHAQRGLLLSPLDAHIFWPEALLAQALYIDEQFEEAVSTADRLAARRPDVMFNLRVLIASQVATGRITDARQNARRLMQALPNFRLSSYTTRCPFQGNTLNLWIERLHTAGLPE
jgi:class 3 adenylate cyclase/TolB-like protein